MPSKGVSVPSKGMVDWSASMPHDDEWRTQVSGSIAKNTVAAGPSEHGWQVGVPGDGADEHAGGEDD